MIKITINGYIVEVSSVEEARQLVNKPTPTVSKVVTPKVAKRKYKKASMRNVWEKVEVEYILKALDLGVTSGALVKSPALRTRHSKLSIGTFVSQINRYIGGFKNKLGSDAVKTIENYRGTPIAVKRG